MSKPNGTTAAAPPEPWTLPSVELRLDKPRRVSFPMPAIRKYEDRSGIKLLEPPVAKPGETAVTEERFFEWLLGDTPRKRSENIERLCWAGLLADDCKASGLDPDDYWQKPALKVSFVAMHIGPNNMRQVLAACVTALTLSLGTDTDRPRGAEAAPIQAEAEAEMQSA